MSKVKTGPNEPCPCGSQKKFKKCCLKQQLQQQSDALIERSAIQVQKPEPRTKLDTVKGFIQELQRIGERHFFDAYLGGFEKTRSRHLGFENYTFSLFTSFDEDVKISVLTREKRHFLSFRISREGYLYFSSKESRLNDLVEAFLVGLTLPQSAISSCPGFEMVREILNSYLDLQIPGVKTIKFLGTGILCDLSNELPSSEREVDPELRAAIISKPKYGIKKEIGNLFYFFSDGRFVPQNQLIKSGLYLLLPKELFSLMLATNPEETLFLRNQASLLSAESEDFFECLFKSSALLDKANLEVLKLFNFHFVNYSSKESMVRQILPLSELICPQGQQMQVCIDYPRLSLKYFDEESFDRRDMIFVTEDWIYDCKNYRLINTKLFMWDDYGEHTKKQFNIHSNRFDFDLSESSHFKFDPAFFCSRLKNAFGVDEVLIENQEENYELKLRLDFFQTNRKSLCWRPVLELNNCSVINMPIPRLWIRVLMGLQEGFSVAIDEFFYEEDFPVWAEYLEEHSGFYLAFIQGLFNILNIDTCTLQELKLPVFFDDMKALSNAILKKKGQPEISAKNKEWRQFMKTLVDAVYEDLLMDHAASLVVSGNRLYKVKVMTALKALIDTVVVAKAYGSATPVFLKTRITTRRGDILSEWGSDTSQAIELKEFTPTLAAELLEISNNVLVFQDGVEFDSISASDLIANIPFDETATDKYFDLHPEIFFKGKRLDREQTINFMTQSIVIHDGIPYVINRKKIPTLKWLNYFWSKIRSKETSKNYGSKNLQQTMSEPMPRDKTLSMLALHYAGVPVIGGELWKKTLSAFERICGDSADKEDSVRFNNLKSELGIPLKEFQCAGVEWLWNHFEMRLGCILADDMGLGKTVQTIAFLKLLQIKNQLGFNAVFVPSSLVYNWVKEFQRFAPSVRVGVFDPKIKLSEAAKDWDVLIISYGMMLEHQKILVDVDWNILIFDEAQNLKNIQSQRSVAARSLKGQFAVALTGTPMENHYGEFYSVVDLVVRGALGPLDEFMKIYGRKVSLVEGATTSVEDVDFLRRKVRPLMLRRSKDKILTELPTKTETVISLPFEKAQRKLYMDTAASWNKKIEQLISTQGESKSQLQMLSALMRLRQICSHPAVVPDFNYKKIPPKFEMLAEVLEELVSLQKSAVVFTNFKATLLELEAYLKSKGIFTLSFTGDTPTAKRSEILDRFDRMNGHCVLLMTQKVGGVGLNLTKANYVFHLEPWWNPAVENQASDRVHRMGQRQSVQVYRYIMEHSIEERMQTLKLKKSKLFESLMDDSEDESQLSSLTKTGLSKEDFKFLLEG